MTNYNDGKWHGWNGGECPVHPETEIEGIYTESTLYKGVIKGLADAFSWGRGEYDLGLVAFRVVKEHREPREFWIMTEKGVLRSYRASKPDVVPFGWECIHVREVIE